MYCTYYTHKAGYVYIGYSNRIQTPRTEAVVYFKKETDYIVIVIVISNSKTLAGNNSTYK